jgi:hypothetical protein
MEIIMLVVVVGIWSCVGVIYRNSRTNTKQLAEIIELLKQSKE